VAKPPPVEEVEPESAEKRPSFFDVFNVDRYEAVEAEIKAEEAKLKAAGMGKGAKGLPKAPAPRQRQQSRPDEDLFNLSGGLFGTQPLAPLLAPDLSALSPGLSKEISAPPARPSAPSAQAPAQAASATPAPLAAPVLTNPAAATPTPPLAKAADASDLDFPKAGPRFGKKQLVFGLVAVGLLAVATFLLVRGGSSEDPAPTETASTEAAPADRAGNAPTNDTPQAAAQPAAPGAAPGAKSPDPAADKRPAGDAKGADRPADRDKAKTADKAPEKDTGGKTAAADPKAAAPPGGGDKSQSLAAAMAAGASPGSAAPEPAAGGGADFNASAARSALAAAAGAASGCKKPDDPSGVAKVSVTFAPSGRATKAQVNGPPFAGTATGGCIAAAFRSASVPPFSGSPVTVSKSVTIR
jgi:hypothetical protein